MTGARAERTFRAFLSGLLILAFSGCSRKPTQNEEQDAEEAVFRYLFQQHSGSLDTVYFISVPSRGLDNDFLKRFQDNVPRVELNLHGFAGIPIGGGRVVDKRTGGPATIFSLQKIQWVNRDEVEVQGYLECGTLCGFGGTFRVRRMHEVWVVEMTNGYVS
jgi:hypothetical protein